ncbi:hypothetical protein [Mesorhizobium sanjuanii]|uniref:hypothetical protein n=1 Tax=Mesorhizobium sanjuanii TaxID=2037900 RepID=UPI0010562B44|nr:hypothetical protein [Mesorhizobium sanjuanii]
MFVMTCGPLRSCSAATVVGAGPMVLQKARPAAAALSTNSRQRSIPFLAIGGGALIVSVTGLFLKDTAAVHAPLGMLLIVASLALLAAIFAALVERRDL